MKLSELSTGTKFYFVKNESPIKTTAYRRTRTGYTNLVTKIHTPLKGVYQFFGGLEVSAI